MRRIIGGLALAAMATLGPSWSLAAEQDEKEFAQGIAAALRDSGQMKDYSVGVKCKQGTVWLAGRVANSEQMDTALQIVSDLEGVEQIVNNMTVGSSKPQPMVATPPAVPARSVQLTGGANTPPETARPQVAAQARRPVGMPARNNAPTPVGYTHIGAQPEQVEGVPVGGRPIPAYAPGGGGVAPARFDSPHMPNYAWPSYAAYPNYAALTYPKQYSASAWPYIGPFYPYPQVPMGWRKVTLEWDDGWWFLDFDDRSHH